MCMLAPLLNIPEKFLCRILDFPALRLEWWEKNEKTSLQCSRRPVLFVFIWDQRGGAASRRIARL